MNSNSHSQLRFPGSRARYTLHSAIRNSQRAFTLLEMLTVLAIIGLLTGLTLPFLKGLSRSNTMASATRQLLDDIELARHRAIAGHTTVYMIFIPPASQSEAPIYNPQQLNRPHQWTNLLTGQATSYALVTRRGVGEQPGQQNPYYLTKWHSLPQGTFIPEYKFYYSTNTIAPTPQANYDIPQFLLSTNFPVPTVDSNSVAGGTIAFIAFDYLGRLVDEGGSPLLRDEYIPLAQGSIFFERDTTGGLTWSKADMRETPPDNSLVNYNLIRIDGLTGRAKVERLEVK